MDGLWKLSDKGLAGFVRKLGRELMPVISERAKEDYLVDVGYAQRDNNDNCYSIKWSYDHKFFGDVMVSRRPYGTDNLIIDHFWNIDHSQSSSSSSDLKTVAQIHEDVAGFVQKKFGKPVSEHDGRSIYRGKLEAEEVQAISASK